MTVVAGGMREGPGLNHGEISDGIVSRFAVDVIST